MLIDRKQIPWALLFLAALAGSIACYVPYAQHAPNGPNGRTWEGLTFGGVGTAFIVFAALIGLRKKRPTWRIGRAETWLRSHIWLGLLSGPLILFHSGFLIGGALTLTLWILLILVLLTGLIGLGLQQFLPRMMTQRVQAETIYEQLNHMIDRLRRDADELVTAKCGPLAGDAAEVAAADGAGLKKAPKGRAKAAAPTIEIPRENLDRLRDFYIGMVQPFLRPGRVAPSRELSSRERSRITFARQHALLVPELHETLRTLEDICDERRQMATQRRLHLVLHGWIFIHAPLSWALVVLSIVHAVITLRF